MSHVDQLADAWDRKDREYPKSEGFGPRLLAIKVKTIHETPNATLCESNKGRFWLPKTVSTPNSYGEIYIRENFRIQYLKD